MWRRLRARAEWRFFAVLPKADPRLAVAWWLVLLARGLLPAGFAVATGLTVGAVEQSTSLVGPLVATGLVFVAMQVVTPLHTAVSLNLGNAVSTYLNERLITSCVTPPGIGHLEDPELAEDLTVAREFDRGQTGPPMSLNVDFVADGLVGLVVGASSAVVLAGFALVGSGRAARGLGFDALAAAGERGLEGPQHPGGPGGAAARRLRVLPGRRPAGRPRSCGCSACRTGCSTASPSAGGSCSSCSTGPPGSASARSPWR